jgi:hypothetical protein
VRVIGPPGVYRQTNLQDRKQHAVHISAASTYSLGQKAPAAGELLLYVTVVSGPHRQHMQPG